MLEGIKKAELGHPNKGALIIGGSPAGLQAGLDLADSGIKVHLVDPSPFLGGGPASPEAETTSVAPHLLNARLLEVIKHPNITTWTNSQISHVEAKAGRFRVELRQRPRYIDLSKCTACGDCVQVCPVTVPGSQYTAIHLNGGGQPGCAVIEKLGKAPCSNACPGGIHVQGYVALIARGRFQEAIDLIREAIPFPGICGRICTHPCEINCRRAEVDKPVSIRLLKRFVADWQLTHDGQVLTTSASEQQAVTSGKQVAIVGAGPGGMAVADRLARMGYRVTVFEQLPVIGGMMAAGIPEYRLPRDVIAREYSHIQALGVEIRLNTTIGPAGDHTLDDLFEMGYEAVCLAIGAHKSHMLHIPGEELSGVVHGIQLLKTISLSQQLDDPAYQAEFQQLLRRGSETRVAVLGGGNTAMDVSRSLRRLGVKDVRILYRRSRQEMPAMPEEIEDAEREGVALEFLISPVRVLGEEKSGVTGLECVRMKLGEPDASGRRRPVPIAGSETAMDLDLVVLAVGQAPDLDLLGQEHGIAITRDERINVDGLSFMTSRPGVFSAGDAVTSDKMAVIEAIGMGKRAAAAIDAYLQGEQPHEVVVNAREVPIARREMREEELQPKARIPVPSIPMEQRLSTYKEVELGYMEDQAMAEAQRCLLCGPCSECMACVDACKAGAVAHEQHETITELDLGAIIYAGDPLRFDLPVTDSTGLQFVPPGDPLLGSAAAAKAMFDLFAERESVPALTILGSDRRNRVGVFVCQCGGQISDVVDTQAVRDRAAGWPGVVYAEVLPFSCSPEAAQAIDEAVAAHELSQVVLAACSCCSIDQVCYSCTYQRVRCKDNLGVFLGQTSTHAAFEFVNIREQCAWAHADDPQAATLKATALTAAAVAKARVMAHKPQDSARPEHSVLIAGSGPAAQVCHRALAGQGIAVQRVTGLPGTIQRAEGHYAVTRDGSSWQAGSIVLAPDADEISSLSVPFDRNGRPWGGMETQRPGIFQCDPGLDPAVVGQAAAARVAAWLGRAQGQPESIVAWVDAARCRACNTCVEICEFGAPQLVGQDPQRRSHIDPSICTGCGTCAAHCPSGAITAGYSTDAQLEAMIEQVIG
jgi:NADPH-dependent glutamate synthase beta subunit-like oxidoreductase/formate hydrogenlyase subunit 6/NADH:ubiquinone oxidoreductase subunit I